MQKVCRHCGAEYEVDEEDASSECSNCVRKTFRKADASGAPELDELRRQQEARRRKQAARAGKFSRFEIGEGNVQPVQFLLLIFGFVVAAFVVMVFMVSESMSASILTNMSTINQRVLVVFMGVIAGGLIWLSARHHRIYSFVAGLATAVFLWFVPDLWPPLQHLAKVQEGLVPEEVGKKPEVVQQRFLKESELAAFYDRKNRAPDVRYVAIYVHMTDHMVREQLRAFLHRISGSVKVAPTICNQGTLYVLEGSKLSEGEVENMLARIGSVRFAEGDVYEVVFDPERSYYKNRFSNDILVNKFDPSFAQANISELRCFDPLRIGDSASRLAQVNTASFRADIRASLLALAREPWAADNPVLLPVARALSVYGRDTSLSPQDVQLVKEAVQGVFIRALKEGKDIPEDVALYLVDVAPDEMLDVVVAQWVKNPAAWENALTHLGKRAEPALINILQKQADNVQLVYEAVRMLGNIGTYESIDVLEKLALDKGTLGNVAQNAIGKIKAR